MAQNNEVTLFSNGIGHFRRGYTIPVGDDQRISIPFNREHIGDVAASLQIFGPVRLKKQPSYTPANANNTALQIDQTAALQSLFTNLSGAQVAISIGSTVHEGVLLGLDTDHENTPSGRIEREFVTVLTSTGFRRILVSGVTNVEFKEESVRTEIDKAIKNNFQKIKPDSTFLDFVIAATGAKDAEAQVQYTIPVAAWKMRYAIREDKGKFSFEGAAIIDNNTDEDWNDFQISVVTGNPISFSTDIASVSMPQRRFVQVTEGYTQGNVSVQEGYSPVMAAACSFGGNKNSRDYTTTRSAGFSKMSLDNSTQYGLESCDAIGGSQATPEMELAEIAGVDAKEVGDFCVFTSKEPITILARKSAVVPMFSVPLAKAGVVLYYKETSNARRPYRAVKFKNETEYSLGKGKTVIYNEGVFSGECVLEATKPGENRMLPHCLENGVRIIKEFKGTEATYSAFRLSEGVAEIDTVSRAVTNYVIENKKDEPFRVALEHTNAITNLKNLNFAYEGVEIKEIEKLADGTGARVFFELAPLQKLTLSVTEVGVNTSTTRIGQNYSWLKSHVISISNPLAENPKVKVAAAIQAEIDDIQTRLNEAQTEKQDLTARAKRVRENLAAAGQGQHTAKWIDDLDNIEKEIRTVEKTTIPGLTQQNYDLLKKLTAALRDIRADWRAAK